MGRKPKSPVDVLAGVVNLDCTTCVDAVVDETATAIDVGVKKLKKRVRDRGLKGCLGEGNTSSTDSLPADSAAKPKKQRKSSSDKLPKVDASPAAPAPAPPPTATESEQSSSAAKKSVPIRSQLLSLDIRVTAIERLIVGGQVPLVPPSEPSADTSKVNDEDENTNE